MCIHWSTASDLYVIGQGPLMSFSHIFLSDLLPGCFHASNGESPVSRLILNANRQPVNEVLHKDKLGTWYNGRYFLYRRNLYRYHIFISVISDAVRSLHTMLYATNTWEMIRLKRLFLEKNHTCLVVFSLSLWNHHFLVIVFKTYMMFEVRIT